MKTPTVQFDSEGREHRDPIVTPPTHDEAEAILAVFDAAEPEMDAERWDGMS